MSEINFNINLPKGWQDQTMYYFKGPKLDEFEHEIMMTIDRKPQTDDIIEFARKRISPIVQTMTGIDVLKDKQTSISGGNESYEFVYKWIPADQMVEIHKYIYVLKDKLGFTFNIRFTKKSYKLLNNQIKEILESILPGTYELE